MRSKASLSGPQTMLMSAFRWLARAVWFAAVCLVLGLTSMQALIWLRFGVWPMASLLDLLEACNFTLRSDWRGVQIVLDHAAGLPAASAILGSGFFVALAILWTGKILTANRRGL